MCKLTQITYGSCLTGALNLILNCCGGGGGRSSNSVSGTVSICVTSTLGYYKSGEGGTYNLPCKYTSKLLT